ncbi:MAG: molybdate ABC transporter permease subunit [Candidatus Eisenbacteria bacterium]|nr:molybdate ABC transporter permease subunit [Candidatus Eisenbacteria bacterium]MCC7142844.1 molybdate ABC transporter permease subunit [Candidatus Eisenbacteria bacterium]
MDWQAIGLTVRLAASTTAILFLIGVPLAYWLATSRRRWRYIVDALVALPLVLPPTVVGFYLLVATGPRSPFGRLYEQATGALLPFSYEGILLGSVIFNLPFAVRPFAAAFAAVDRRLIEASWCLGESRFITFFRITFRTAWPGVLAGLVLAFAHTVGEFGVVLMLGGNIPGETRTVSIAIYDSVQALKFQEANATALLLLGFSFLVLCITYSLQHRKAFPL